MGDELNELFADELVGDEDFNPDGFGDCSVVMVADGCEVEPDGRCPHGKESPMLRLGLV